MKVIQWDQETWKSRFFTIWGGQAVSLFGSQLVQFALIWWLTEKTGSGTVLAMASLAGFLPQLLLGPLVGTLVDRWNRRWTMILADGLIALATLVLAFLFAIDRAGIGAIYGILVIRSLGGAFHWPAMSAATSLMVPKEQLTRVQGLNQMLQGGLSIIAAPLGALLVSLISTQAILMIDVVTAAASILPLLLIVIPEPQPAAGAEGESRQGSFWEDFRAGFAYVLAWPGLVMILLLAILINFLLHPTSALEPLLVTKHYGGGAVQLAYLQSAFGLGILVGGLLLSVWGGFKKKILTTMTGLVGLGIFFSLLGFFPSNGFIYAVGAAFMAAMMIPIVNGPIHAIVQATVEPAMQGRVFTLMGSIASAMAPLGLVIAGPLADAYGVRTWYLAAGVVCALTGVIGFFIPAVLTLEDGRTAAQAHNPTPENEPALEGSRS
jgi:DHA3 family macrolide efflux protein-like MFS transporter